MIHGYYTRAEEQLSWRGEGPLYFGVELEVEVDVPKYRISSDVVDPFSDLRAPVAGSGICAQALLGDFALLKKDGSLSNGFEIVTAPATLDQHYAGWQKFFATTPPALTIRDSCGMHVHFTRSALRPCHIDRYIAFITQPQNKRFVVTIAGRESPCYAALVQKARGLARHCCPDGYFGRKCFGKFNRWSPAGQAHFKAHHGLHTESVSLGHKGTVETRIFASTLDPTRFFANLEFVAALIKFSKHRAYNDMCVDKFLTWMQRSRQQTTFQYLAKFLQTPAFTEFYPVATTSAATTTFALRPTSTALVA
jgi:hypothetical protein